MTREGPDRSSVSKRGPHRFGKKEWTGSDVDSRAMKSPPSSRVSCLFGQIEGTIYFMLQWRVELRVLIPFLAFSRGFLDQERLGPIGYTAVN